MDLKIFSELKNIEAGFTCVPNTADNKREELKKRANIESGCLVRPVLVHGDRIATVKCEDIEGKTYIEIPDTDGVITSLERVTLTTTHADCIPVFLYDDVRKVIGLAHAGWKGTRFGIAAKLVKAMIKEYGSTPSDIKAYIAPGIGQCCFEVSKDVAEEFVKLGFVDEYIKYREVPVEDDDGRSILKANIDIKAVNREFLKNEGVVDITVDEDCTCCLEGKYYSHRRDKDARRMLAYICMR